MLKKLLALLLAAVMVLSLAACVSTDPAEENGDTQGNIPDAAGNDIDTEASAGADQSSAADFEETVLVEDENITVKITGIEEDSLWGYALQVYLENKTDKDLTYTADSVSVNGFMCDPFWATTVTAGMKSNEEITFFASDFEANGISAVTEIEMNLRVYDSGDILADDLFSQTFTIFPLGPEAVMPYERQAQEGEIVLFDNQYCTMIVTGVDPDATLGYALNVYLENKTDKELMFSTDNVSVNGFMCDPFWATTVAAGKRSNTQIVWFDTSLTDAGITDVTTISLPVTVYDSNDWLGDYLVEETFTVTP